MVLFRDENKEEEELKEELTIPASPDILDINYELDYIEATLKAGKIKMKEDGTWVIEPGKKEDWLLNEEGIREIMTYIRGFFIPKIAALSFIDVNVAKNLAVDLGKTVAYTLFLNYERYEVKSVDAILFIAKMIAYNYYLLLTRGIGALGLRKIGFAPPKE